MHVDADSDTAEKRKSLKLFEKLSLKCIARPYRTNEGDISEMHVCQFYEHVCCTLITMKYQYKQLLVFYSLMCIPETSTRLIQQSLA